MCILDYIQNEIITIILYLSCKCGDQRWVWKSSKRGGSSTDEGWGEGEPHLQDGFCWHQALSLCGSIRRAVGLEARSHLSGRQGLLPRAGSQEHLWDHHKLHTGEGQWYLEVSELENCKRFRKTKKMFIKFLPRCRITGASPTKNALIGSNTFDLCVAASSGQLMWFCVLVRCGSILDWSKGKMDILS